MSATAVPGILVFYYRPDYLLRLKRLAIAASDLEHIHSFRAHSRFAVWEVNTHLGFPRHLERAHPTVIFLHNTLWIPAIPMRMTEWLRGVDAYKVAFFHDEFHFCQERFHFVNDVDVDLIYTHVHPEDIPQVWDRFTPRATARFNYPGYVDRQMVAAAARFARPDAQRDIDVGYRARSLDPYMGSGALEKSLIGDQFKELAAGAGLTIDIDTTEEGRLYGEDWYRFLGRTRVALGVESGTSYIDLEDEVLRDYEARVEARRPVTLEALQEGPLGRLDHNYSYRTISPRHFEAAAFRICQVLFEGQYSGVLEPMVHYVPLKKDFSNFEEVIELIGDKRLREQIAENAHRDLIRSGTYSYERFVAGVDDDLSAAGLNPAIAPAQRAKLSLAIQRSRVWRRAVIEAKSLSISLLLIIAHRVPRRWRTRLKSLWSSR
ncbi:MAG TPA: hypothetical protein VGX69_06055 [Solirubrobacteraceae bacterium]|jgi:hypothetical protein|nr:hypothetical protein [Solirubrobacteraceae bacterium]